MSKKLLLLGSILGLTAVILGAFASHGLEKHISQEAIQTFEVGVRYQFYHAFLALFCGMFSRLSAKAKNVIFYFILIGIVLFSGSIYGLATNSLSSFDFTTIGFITPIGGMLLIMVWLWLIISLLKIKSE
ncbi:DUF423 domain-containing protein [Mesonia sp. K7]|uniref:DUF423 domain-containing protein n=1 Tax=Mesonia sp. K7 TaxID=2218606 RepID=UPI000DAAC15C|nr:DUF423 domain-containing protein [Mesonia sp. K7]PZD77743.1 DUF423 domain-containing protein [Mesonia sp. K7]